jgi:hypothetical protein
MRENVEAVCGLNFSDKAKRMVFYDNAAKLFPV